MQRIGAGFAVEVHATKAMGQQYLPTIEPCTQWFFPSHACSFPSENDTRCRIPAQENSHFDKNNGTIRWKEQRSDQWQHTPFHTALHRCIPLYPERQRGRRTKDEVDQIIRWLFGYSQHEIDVMCSRDRLWTFVQTPPTNPARMQITGIGLRVRFQDIEDPIMREIRYLYKLIDELAKGKAMEKSSLLAQGTRNATPKGVRKQSVPARIKTAM